MNIVTNNTLSTDPVAPNKAQDTLLRLLALHERRKTLETDLLAVDAEIKKLRETDEVEALAAWLAPVLAA